MIVLALATVLAFVLLAGYIAVLVGIRREDKAMSLHHAPVSISASLARRVTGCHVRNGVAS